MVKRRHFLVAYLVDRNPKRTTWFPMSNLNPHLFLSLSLNLFPLLSLNQPQTSNPLPLQTTTSPPQTTITPTSNPLQTTITPTSNPPPLQTTINPTSNPLPLQTTINPTS